MNRFKLHGLSASLVIMTLVLAAGEASAQAGGDQKIGNVFVVNTPAAPLPTVVQGTASVTGTVTIGNTPDVTIANQPTVNLATGSAVAITGPVMTRDSDHPARQPFQTERAFIIGEGSVANQVDLFASTPVPAGKVFVLEHVSARVDVPEGQKILTFLQVPYGKHYLNMTLQGTFVPAGDIFTASLPMKLYVGAGQSLFGVCARNSSAGSSLVVFEISGYMVDLP